MACSAIVPIAALAIAASAPILTSCEKEKPTKHNPQPQPEPQKRNVTIELNGADNFGGVSQALHPDVLTPYSEDNSVDTIFIEPYGDWSWLRGPNQNFVINSMKYIRSNYPKTWGRGDFNFYPGDLSAADSLWFVDNGWTINKHLQNQR